jgi:hypothetical protein
VQDQFSSKGIQHRKEEMIWVKNDNELQGDKLSVFGAQTLCDLKALLLAALAGAVLAVMIALLMMATLSMTTPA